MYMVQCQKCGCELSVEYHMELHSPPGNPCWRYQCDGRMRVTLSVVTEPEPKPVKEEIKDANTEADSTDSVAVHAEGT